MTDQTELRVFHNRLRRLLNIDMSQLVEAGVIEPHDYEAWRHFQACPWLWFIKADDAAAEKVWDIIESGR